MISGPRTGICDYAETYFGIIDELRAEIARLTEQNEILARSKIGAFVVETASVPPTSERPTGGVLYRRAKTSYTNNHP